MACEPADGDATPSGLRLCEMMALSPGLPKRNTTTPCGLPARGPRSWAVVCERFQRYPFR
jgi:hypothetical protein